MAIDSSMRSLASGAESTLTNSMKYWMNLLVVRYVRLGSDEAYWKMSLDEI